jgi:glycosyltransferase involved in cell wall biosynthesis
LINILRTVKVLLVNSSRIWGGNEKWTLRAAETLQARGHDVWMAIREPSVWEGHARTPVQQVVFSFLNDADVKTVFALRRFIRRHRIDVILPTRSRDYWLSGFARMRTPARYVMRMGITRELPNTIKERLRYGRFPDGIVVNAVAVKDSLARHPWVKADRIRVIYNGVDTRLADGKSQPVKENGDFLVVAAGRVESDKGFDVLVSAAALAVKEIPQLRVVIFGRGDRTEPLREQINELGLTGTVKLGGFTRNVSSALAQADLAVSSSYREGGSNFILEAWSVGTPIIATDLPGSTEIITDGLRGRIVPTGDPERMAGAIVEAYRNPALRSQWTEAGREAVAETFNWDTMGLHLEEFLGEVIARQSNGISA